jgi:hypothetical protein
MGLSSNDVEELLWKVISRFVSIQTDSERMYFSELVKTAARRVADDRNGQRVDLAVNNLKTIVSRGQPFQSGLIGHKEFVRTLSSLCPMWPFC